MGASRLSSPGTRSSVNILMGPREPERNVGPTAPGDSSTADGSRGDKTPKRQRASALQVCREEREGERRGT